MSFGKRMPPQSGAAQPAFKPAPKQVTYPDPANSWRQNGSQQEETILSTLVFAASAITLFGALAFIALLYVPKPLFETAPSTVYYGQRAFSKMLITSMTPPRSRVNMQNRHNLNIDLSGLILKKGLSENDIMLAVTKECLPARVPVDSISPVRGHIVYRKITKYVSCVMQTETRRFCKKSERQRLVSQLKHYSHFRQSLIGVENIARKLMLATPAGRYELNNSPDRDLPFPPIGKNVNPEVIKNLSGLIAKGYITMSDFSFMGLSLPKDYAPAFKATPEGPAPDCGQV